MGEQTQVEERVITTKASTPYGVQGADRLKGEFYVVILARIP
ncbi:hypothetical protein [Streptosporangium saharense]